MRYYKTLPDCYQEELRDLINENGVLSFELERHQNRLATDIACDFLSLNNISDMYIKSIDLYNSYNISGGTIDYKVLNTYNFLLSLGVSEELVEVLKNTEIKIESNFDVNNYNYYSIHIDGYCDLNKISESELDFIHNVLNNFNNEFQNCINIDDVMVEAQELAIDEFINDEIIYYTYDEDNGVDFNLIVTEDYLNFLNEVEIAKKQLLVNRLNRQLKNKQVVKKVNKI